LLPPAAILLPIYATARRHTTLMLLFFAALPHNNVRLTRPLFSLAMLPLMPLFRRYIRQQKCRTRLHAIAWLRSAADYCRRH